MPTLRPYQSKSILDVDNAWSDLVARLYPNPVVMLVSPTGTGKTVMFSEVMTREPGASIAIAHRKEITTQISLALARNGVRHRIIGQKNTRKACEKLHLRKLKRSFVDPNAKCAAAGIDTLINIKPTDPQWAFLQSVKLWVGDEGHHFLRDNKWGKGVAMLPNARGLLVTATPCRADGKGLGRHADGLADAMVLGPTQREAIDMGYLVDYQVAMPESDVDIRMVEIGSTGDFNQTQLREAFHKSKNICGDVVKAWQKFAPGKLTVVFAVDVEEATKIAKKFRDEGVEARMVCADTPDDMRDNILEKFARREILVLVNVDLFGEGFDLPNIECVIMARHTASFSLYSQQWGRGGRLDIPVEWMASWDSYSDEQRRYMISISAKPYMMLIDMVGNVERHNGPPDCRTKWSMDRRASGATNLSEDDAVATRLCANKDKFGDGSDIACSKTYERFYTACPYCHFVPVPAVRSTPVQVDGDITLLDSATLAEMYADKSKIMVPAGQVAHGESMVARAIRNRHHERQVAQHKLRRAIVWWASYQDKFGRSDLREQHKLFYLTFGTDTATAQTLGTREADELRVKISDKLALVGIDATVSIE